MKKMNYYEFSIRKKKLFEIAYGWICQKIA